MAQGYGDVNIVAKNPVTTCTIMRTKGVIFDIPEGTRVDFSAAAFILERNEVCMAHVQPAATCL